MTSTTRQADGISGTAIPAAGLTHWRPPPGARHYLPALRTPSSPLLPRLLLAHIASYLYIYRRRHEHRFVISRPHGGHAQLYRYLFPPATKNSVGLAAL
jgi:hypothetical protein